MDLTDEHYESLVDAINISFVITLSIIVFFMQAGFAFLEAGSVRAKNTTNIIVKNLIDCGLGALAFWAIGWAFAYGADGNSFIGYKQFFLSATNSDRYASFFNAYVFAATSATIVSGAIAERVHLMSYFVFTFIMTGFIYPVVVHWVWSPNGWLSNLGYIDFAGSSVVHAVGGASALTGAVLAGPRLGRFDKRGVLPIPGHSTVLVALGFFILWYGFFAFNGVSEGGIAGEGFNPENVSRAVVNTGLAGSGALITALGLLKLGLARPEMEIFGREIRLVHIFGGVWSICGAINGALSGMVAICAGAFCVEPWAAFVIGVIAGANYCVLSRVLLFLRIDDPLEASVVHMGGGIWGIISVGLFLHHDRVDHIPDGGILYAWDGDAFIQFGIQAIGVTVISFWAIALTAAIFLPLRLAGLLRVSPEAEEDGLDFVNGEPAYPVDPALVFTGGTSSTKDFSDFDSDAVQ